MGELTKRFASLVGTTAVALMPHVTSAAAEVSPPVTCRVSDTGQVTVVNKKGDPTFKDQLRRPSFLEKASDWSAQLVGNTGPITISSRPTMHGEATVCHFTDLNGKPHILDVVKYNGDAERISPKYIAALKLDN